MTLVILDDAGKPVHKEQLQQRDAAKPFKSGKTGFGAYGKVNLPDGTRAQLSFNLVRIEK